MRSHTLDSYQQRVSAVVAHVCDHLDEPLDPGTLARVACFSRHHFSRMFRGMLGESPLDFVRRLRLERAARSLQEAATDVTGAALDAGYTSPEAFARAFKSRFGRSPSDWRERPACSFPPVPSRFHFGSPIPQLQFLNHEEFDMDVQVSFRASMHIACKQHRGAYEGIGPKIAEVAEYCGRAGLFGMYTQAVGVYWDDPTTVPEPELRSMGGFVVVPAFEGDREAGIEVYDLAPGEYAIATHVGPYEDIPQSYHQLVGQWLPQSGRTPLDGPCYEIYVSDPATTPPEELITKIHLPLAPAD